MFHFSEAPKKIVLLGSGHSHLEVLKILSKKEISQHQFILISPQKTSHYTGLIPRLIAGDITAEELTISSARYAEAKGLEFIQDSAVAIDESQKTVSLASGRKIPFDILSINIGGVQKTENQISTELSVYLRPFDQFLENWLELQKKLAGEAQLSFAVLGGGAAAVEVATALHVKLSRLFPKSQNLVSFQIHLISKGSRPCPNYSEKISKTLEVNLLKMGIKIHFEQEILASGLKIIHLKQNLSLKIDQVFLATPTVPEKLALKKANQSLQISPSIFAAGDCILMEKFPALPRSGVIAVHQGRLLAKNIRNILAEKNLISYKPAAQQLNILICGPKTALAVWGQWSYQGYLPWLLKKWIDQRYMQSF